MWRKDTDAVPFKVVIIGAGQAGLSAAYYLIARGLRPWDEFVVLDANEGPGGAWRHRWNSLTFGGSHNIHPLPQGPLEPPNPNEPANRVVPRYYGSYEERHGLPVARPVSVSNVSNEGGLFTVETSKGRLRARSVINATGTWDSPFVPHYPGLEKFTGTILHARDYRNASAFDGERVLIVGGGTTAVQLTQELNAAGVETVWSTRTEPRWTTTSFNEEWGRDVEKKVSERTQAGLRPLSVVAVTGLPLDERYRKDIESGVLISRGKVNRFKKRSVILDGPGPNGCNFPSQGAANSLISQVTREKVPCLPGHTVDDSDDFEAESALWAVPINTILWATGFRAHTPHLSHLGLREPGGGILMGKDGVTAMKMPGLYLAGYGASASTLGATRAGRRAAVRAITYATEAA